MSAKNLSDNPAHLVSVSGLGSIFDNLAAVGVTADSRRREQIPTSCCSESTRKSAGKTNLAEDVGNGLLEARGRIVLNRGSCVLQLENQAGAKCTYVASAPISSRNHMGIRQSGDPSGEVRFAVDPAVPKPVEVLGAEWL